MTKTPAEAAADWLCPLARVFAAPKAEPMCQGPKCAAWRWMPVTTAHPAFKTALATAAVETGTPGLTSSSGVPDSPETGRSSSPLPVPNAVRPSRQAGTSAPSRAARANRRGSPGSIP